jgi:hypothetical protein
LTLTSSNAVKDFLPSGSTPSMLPYDMVNPGGAYSNVLAGQLVAAMINVTVDACDPNFGASNEWIGNAWFVGGPFDGYGVWDVIYAANQYIGGCGGSFTAAEFNTALTNFNENYGDGTANNGYIDCGKKKDEELRSMVIGHPMDRTVLHPNPASDALTLDITSAADSRIEVRILDLSGRMAMPTEVFTTKASQNQKLTLDVAGLANGTYLMQINRNGAVEARSFVIAR